MNSLTKREHVLLIAALLVAVGMGYWLFRYRPLAAEIQTRRSQAETAEKDLEKFKLPSAPRGDADGLTRELEQLDEALALQRTRLAELEVGFAPTDDPGSVQQLKVELSELANRAGIKIEESVPYEADKLKSAGSKSVPAGETAVESAMLTSVYRRPMHRIKMQCQFANLIRFVEGLGQLSHRVVVLQLDLGTPQDADKAPQPMLQAEVVLAL